MPAPARFLKELVHSEGSIPHLYLDTRGHVTVGVGCLIGTLEEAQALPFVERASGRHASRAEIQLDWQRVRAEPAGRIASSYRPVTRLDLPEPEIRRMLGRRVDAFQAGLRRQFETYERMPEDVRLALLDMAFNLGLNGLVTKFPKFCGAIRRSDWRTAAKECRRRGVSDERNDRVERWLGGVTLGLREETQG